MLGCPITKNCSLDVFKDVHECNTSMAMATHFSMEEMQLKLSTCLFCNVGRLVKSGAGKPVVFSVLVRAHTSHDRDTSSIPARSAASRTVGVTVLCLLEVCVCVSECLLQEKV